MKTIKNTLRILLFTVLAGNSLGAMKRANDDMQSGGPSDTLYHFWCARQALSNVESEMDVPGDVTNLIMHDYVAVYFQRHLKPFLESREYYDIVKCLKEVRPVALRNHLQKLCDTFGSYER